MGAFAATHPDCRREVRLRRQLRKDNRELRMERDILKKWLRQAPSVVFAWIDAAQPSRGPVRV